MHVFSLWGKLLAGRHRSQDKAKPGSKTGSKTKTSQAEGKKFPEKVPETGHGPRRASVSANSHGAGGDGFVRSVLGAIGVRMLKTMTSRSRVCGNKYKVNNQNLEKFEQILSKIPEGEKAKPALSTTSLPERREELCRTPVQPPPERLGPDIGPSATMGSSVTAEYELFCKAFHSEAKQLLPEEEQEKVPVNPMRQLLQQASEAAARGLQLQRVTSAAGTPPGATPIGTRTPETASHSAARAPGFVASTAASAAGTVCPPTPVEVSPPSLDEIERDELLAQLVDLQGRRNLEKQREREAAEQRQQQQQQQAKPADEQVQEPQEKRPKKAQQRPKHSRRWSENPVGAPIFMARKFAEKLRRSREVVTPGTSDATPSTSTTPRNEQPSKKKESYMKRSRKQAAVTLPKIPVSPSSKQPSPSSTKPGAEQQQQQPQSQTLKSPSSTSRESLHHEESGQSSASNKKRGKRKRKSLSHKEP